MKKAQGMSMNVIIIAALAIIVLIILVVVMTGKFNIFGTTMRDCSAQGGSCEFEVDQCDEGYARLRFTNCDDKREYPDGAICCVPVYTIGEEKETPDTTAEEES